MDINLRCPSTMLLILIRHHKCVMWVSVKTHCLYDIQMMSQCPCTISELNRTSAGRPVSNILPRMSKRYRTWTCFDILPRMFKGYPISIFLAYMWIFVLQLRLCLWVPRDHNRIMSFFFFCMFELQSKLSCLQIMCTSHFEFSDTIYFEKFS